MTSPFARLASVGDLEATFPLLVFRRTRAETSGSTRRRTRWLRVRPTNAETQMHRALMAYVRRVWRRPASHGARLAMIVLTRRACSSALSLARTLERRLALLATAARTTASFNCRWACSNPTTTSRTRTSASRDWRTRTTNDGALEAILALARQAAGSGSSFRALARLLRRSKRVCDRLHRIPGHADRARSRAVRLFDTMSAAWRSDGGRAGRRRFTEFTTGDVEGAARHRCGQRGAEPSAAMPTGRPSRGALDANAHRAACRPGRSHRPVSNGPPGAPDRPGDSGRVARGNRRSTPLACRLG